MASGLSKRVSAWFTLTRDERLLVAGVLALLLVGLAARTWHRHRQRSAPYVPPEPAAEEMNDE